MNTEQTLTLKQILFFLNIGGLVVSRLEEGRRTKSEKKMYI